MPMSITFKHCFDVGSGIGIEAASGVASGAPVELGVIFSVGVAVASGVASGAPVELGVIFSIGVAVASGVASGLSVKPGVPFGMSEGADAVRMGNAGANVVGSGSGVAAVSENRDAGFIRIL